ncbi:hypothetical protein [Spirillospora sp. CA-294931]|uniref:hypothetical protein n=1 Tax=Spirillospora sp. CA-294931 TaxID=3240042 RepID=UPI003D8B6008
MPMVRPDESPAGTERPVRAYRASRAWPGTLAAAALIVLAVSWTLTSPLIALILAAATMVLGAFLLTVLAGPAWIRRPRRPSADLWQRR